MIESNTRKELEQQIEDYVHGKLSAKEVDELWAVLIRDEYYMDYMKSVANLKKIAQEKREQSGNTIPLFRNRSSLYAMAAAAVILIIGSFALFDIVSNNAQIQPIGTIELDYYRSSEMASETDADVLREVIVMANNGETEKAISLLDSELANESDPERRSELLITMGSISYNSGNYESAINSFSQVIEHESADKLVIEKAYWYLGNSYFQQNRMNEALEAFRKANDLNGAYSRITESYIKALNTTE